MRKLASIQRVKHVRPIPGADAIEAIGVLGWECVSRKGEFKAGDSCVFFEIDSLLPEDSRYEFLRASSFRPDLGKFRLRTMKLRGQISQGLALPLSLYPMLESIEVGRDLTEILRVEKYDPPVPTQIAGDVRSFLWPIPKTDEVRVQQDDEYGFISKLTGKPYYISLKLDGTSATFIVDPRDGEYHVCGRNYSYQQNSGHSFWRVSESRDIETKLRDHGGLLAIQGEIVGPGIQGNKLGLKVVDLYVFNVVDCLTQERLHVDEAEAIVRGMGLNFVPIIERGASFSYTADELLSLASGKYADHFPDAKPSQEREGIVIRSQSGDVSFKAVSNSFLLREA